jgi:Fur family transcriptional regulator, iron response regulator
LRFAKLLTWRQPKLKALNFIPFAVYKVGMNENFAIAEKLRGAGLRPTQQRLALAKLLFEGCDKHVSAEGLHEDAAKLGISVSLATVYNTLHQFKDAGLLREVAIEGVRSYYDTNTSNHFHFFNEEDGELYDIEPGDLKITGLPTVPAGQEIDRIDVIVRLKKS